MEQEISDVDKLKAEIPKLQNNIRLNAYNYDSHVELVSLLSKLYAAYRRDELENEEKTKEQTKISFNKLRNARQSMSSIYPLTNELWLSWIKDEVDACPTLINHQVIIDIFSKATVDYICVDVWCLYVSYLIKQLDSGECTADVVRDTLERGVLNCGLDYREGNKLWKCYQEFEYRYLLQAEKEVKKSNNHLNVEQYKLQLLKIIKLFKRELSLPLRDNEVSLNRFYETVEPHIKSLSPGQELGSNSNEINVIYEKTVQNMELINTNENNLDTHQHSLEAYESYIMIELESLVDIPRIQCLFERAIVYHCLTPSLWLDYIDFLNNVIKLADLVISVCKRALRNITWDCRIYIKYTTILEQESYSTHDIRQAYEQGLVKYSNNGFNYCNILIACLSFEKRLCKNESGITKKKTIIYNLIQQALHQFPLIEDADKSIVEFVLFWVDIERFWFKDEEKVNDIWKYMLSKYKGLWEHAVTFARTTGKSDLINDIFHIALLQYPHDIDTFSQTLYNYETMSGTIDSLNYLMKKVNLCKLSGVRTKKPKEIQHILSKIEHQNRFMKSWLRNAENSLFFVSNVETSSAKKLVRDAKELKAGKAKGIEKVYLGIEDNRQQQNVGHKRKHAQLMEEDGDSNNASIGPVLPPGFLSNKNNSESETDSDSESDSDSLDSKGDDKEQDDNNEPLVKKIKVDEKGSNCLEPTSYSSNTTVFVSNLHPATKSSELEIIFGRAGQVDKVDLRKQRGGKIFAFVTYKTEEAAQKAFELEHTPLYNRPLYVSPYKAADKGESASVTASHSHYSQTEEKNKLYVSNLSKLTTQIDLEKLFNQYGDMSSLRLINKKGSTRPFAFVEYATVEAAARYLKAINGTQLRGQSIVVAFSNPSVRESQQTGDKLDNKGDAMVIDSETPLNKEVFVKPKPVSAPFVPFQARYPKGVQQLPQTTKKGPAVRINLVPAGDHAANTSDSSLTQNKDQSSTSTVSSARKSNEQFRKMFFKM